MTTTSKPLFDEWKDLLTRSSVEFESDTYGDNKSFISIPPCGEGKVNGGDGWLSVEIYFDELGGVTLFEIS